ncbi:MAG: hypothetical protein ABIP55_13210, partial [Tepidisphaeraceae bacterium]
MNSSRLLIDPVYRRQLAEVLGDSPVNALFIDALLHSDGMALVSGSPTRPVTTLIATAHSPT